MQRWRTSTTRPNLTSGQRTERRFVDDSKSSQNLLPEQTGYWTSDAALGSSSASQMSFLSDLTESMRLRKCSAESMSVRAISTYTTASSSNSRSRTMSLTSLPPIPSWTIWMIIGWFFAKHTESFGPADDFMST